MSDLVLSLFPGADVLGLGFEMEGFCVVQGPEYVFGRRIENFCPPLNRFDGIIGGDPCQSHSSLANLVRAKGLEPKFPDLTPEFARVIEEARPGWFLRENVPKAPEIKPMGYGVTTFLLDNCWLGEAQMRKRRFWFGWPRERGLAPNLWRWIETAAFELPDSAPTVDGGHGAAPWTREKILTQAVSSDSRVVPLRIGGSGKIKSTAVGCDGRHGHRVNDGTGGTQEGNFRSKATAVTGRHDGKVGSPEIDYSPPRCTLAEMLQLQGLPPDWLDDAPYTMHAKRKLVGNAVPLPMARAIAVRRAACRDENEREIIDALRGAGWVVHQIDDDAGFPDLVIICALPKDKVYRTLLMEVIGDEKAKRFRKSGGLTAEQVRFREKWPGPIYYVRTADEALSIAEWGG
jgi:site-specific DNA-cytosine methylase